MILGRNVSVVFSKCRFSNHCILLEISFLYLESLLTMDRSSRRSNLDCFVLFHPQYVTPKYTGRQTDRLTDLGGKLVASSFWSLHA